MKPKGRTVEEMLIRRGAALKISLEPVRNTTRAGQLAALRKAFREAVESREAQERRRADRENPTHVGASMPGTVVAVHRKPGEPVQAGDALLTLEAMKMETVVRAPRAGQLRELIPSLKGAVQAGDLLAVVE